MLQAEVVATMVTMMEGEGPATSAADYSLPSEIGYVSASYVRSFRRQPIPPQ